MHGNPVGAVWERCHQGALCRPLFQSCTPDRLVCSAHDSQSALVVLMWGTHRVVSVLFCSVLFWSGLFFSFYFWSDRRLTCGSPWTRWLSNSVSVSFCIVDESRLCVYYCGDSGSAAFLRAWRRRRRRSWLVADGRWQRDLEDAMDMITAIITATGGR